MSDSRTPVFIITVDTEADNQWARPHDLSVENINYLPRFQKLCQEFNLVPTYLITHEVASDARAVSILRPYQDSGHAEIGAHLHPWTNPPYTRDVAWERKYHRFPHELPPEEFESKLRELTQVITKNFKQPPTSYRAGRWGFALEQVDCLANLGYTAECSMTPKLSWRQVLGDPAGQGGPDFRLTRLMPHFLTGVGKSGLLEVPLTTVFAHWIKEDGRLARWFLRRDEKSFMTRVLNKFIFHRTTARIFASTTSRDLRRLLAASRRNHLPVVEFMIHSSELMPGGSPYAQDDRAIEKLYSRLRELFGLFKQAGFRGLSLRDFAANFPKQP